MIRAKIQASKESKKEGWDMRKAVPGRENGKRDDAEVEDGGE